MKFCPLLSRLALVSRMSCVPPCVFGVVVFLKYFIGDWLMTWYHLSCWSEINPSVLLAQKKGSNSVRAETSRTGCPWLYDRWFWLLLFAWAEIVVVCVCVETEGCKLEELAAQDFLGSDLTFLKEVTQRACCLLIDHCCVLPHFAVGVLQMSSAPRCLWASFEALKSSFGYWEHNSVAL